MGSQLFAFYFKNCEERTHLDSYELLTVICEELPDIIAVGIQQHIAINIPIYTYI